MSFTGAHDLTALIITNAALGILVGVACLTLIVAGIRDAWKHRRSQPNRGTYPVLEVLPRAKSTTAPHGGLAAMVRE